jgi:diphthamide synthase (EF-2-diphthine--ammonia ligase)
VCGERGEYHTFVYDGPGFAAPVAFALGEPFLSEGYWIRPARPA